MPFTPGRWLVLVATLTLAAGCGSSPQPILYDLPTDPGRLAAEQRLRISLDEVDLPTYARSNLIATADGSGRIRLDDDHRWAEPPAEAVTRALARHIEAALDAVVLERPHPSEFAPQYRVRVVFDRLLRTQDGAASVRGRWLVAQAGTGRSLIVIDFAADEPARDAGYAAFMVAMDTALSRAVSTLTAAPDFSEPQ